MLGSSIITSFIVLVSLKYFYFLDAQTSTQSFLNLKGKAHCMRVDITHSHCSSQVSLGMQAGVAVRLILVQRQHLKEMSSWQGLYE